MPSTGGYLVSPRLIAAIAASLMLSGVSKSGSPTDSEMTSQPWAFKSRAFCVTVMMAEGFTRESAWAMKAMDSQILSDARGNEGDVPPLRRRPARPGRVVGQITSRSPRGFLPGALRGASLRTERPRRAERLSRQLGDGGKGVRRETSPLTSCSRCIRGRQHWTARRRGWTPLGFGFFPPPGRDPFCSRPQIALRPLQLDIGPRRGTSARKGKRHPSFVCEAATMRVLDDDGREAEN